MTAAPPPVSQVSAGFPSYSSDAMGAACARPRLPFRRRPCPRWPTTLEPLVLANFLSWPQIRSQPSTESTPVRALSNCAPAEAAAAAEPLSRAL